MPKPHAPEPEKAEPYRADNRPVGSPAWDVELAEFRALVQAVLATSSEV